MPENAHALPILYSFRRCPYAIRARLSLVATSQSILVHEINLARKPACFLRLSAKGTVPVLYLPADGGRIIEESLDIMRWALKRHDPLGWLPDKDTAAESANLIALCDGRFKHHLNRYKYPQRHASDPLAHRRESFRIIDIFAEALQTHQGWLQPGFGLSDLAIFPFIRQLAKVDMAYFSTNAPACLIDWLERLSAWPAFHHAMQKFPTAEESASTAPHLLAGLQPSIAEANACIRAAAT